MSKLANGSYFKSISEFQFLERKSIGKGSFGQVKLALHVQTSKIYAIKIIQPKYIATQVAVKALQRQISIHTQLIHPHIVRLWQVFREEHKIYMVMEYVQKGNLFYHQNEKKVFIQEQASIFFSQTLSAVQYLHSINLVHRDLKPENLLLDRDLNIKICDLGWVVEGISEMHTTFCGTYEYMAPEMIFDRTYDYKIDIWALGILLFQLLHGFAPFQGQTAEEVRQSMMQGQIHFDPDLSANVQNLIFNILKVDPQQRLCIQDIKSHPWILSMNKKRLQQVSQQKSEKELPSYMKLNRVKSKPLNLTFKLLPEQKSQLMKVLSNKMLSINKQKRKQSNRHIQNNISIENINFVKSSKQKLREKDKENAYKFLKSTPSKKELRCHRTQNSDISQVFKNPRLKTQNDLNNKTVKGQIIRFNTETAEMLDFADNRMTLKKKKILPKKVFNPKNLIKTASKQKIIRKSID